MPRYRKITNSLTFYIFTKLKNHYSIKDIAKLTSVSVTTVMRLFDIIGMETNFEVLPEVISINEFKGNSGGRKYHCMIGNPKRRKILDSLKAENTYSYSIRIVIHHFQQINSNVIHQRNRH
ncbi:MULTISPECIES: transposase family protein [Caldanaerobacter]|uniref:transposase family protein n=1 Tax=Caldanaerobacter TaxID=249529 RepID=UPI001B7FF98E|nr:MULTISPECIES: transposase family protein [Caldanaerobacter]